MAEQEVFEYTYSSPRRSEVQKIREKYLPKEVTARDQLRALDAGVTRRGTTVFVKTTTLANIPGIVPGLCGLVMVLTFRMILAGYRQEKA